LVGSEIRGEDAHGGGNGDAKQQAV
jgi:hypothetical protein